MPANADALRIALAQLNPIVGDIHGNAALVASVRAEAAMLGADLVVCPELVITGYPPEDLVLKPAFVRAAKEAAEALAAQTRDGGPAILLGTPWPGEDKPHNSVALLAGGEVAAVRHKVDLPHHGMFDESRVFAPGPMPGPVNFRDVRVGVALGEDIRGEEVCECLAETGAEILLAPGASHWTRAKMDARLRIAVARVTETGLPIACVNQVGGQDELVFDGASFVLNPGGRLAVQMPAWVSSIALTTWRRSASGWRCEDGERVLLEETDAAAYRACVLGLRDYVNKNGFPGVVLGLSGGIDSALSAAMAVDALGADRVHCITMPGRFTAAASLADAAACAQRLGVRCEVMPIHAAVEALEATLRPVFAGGDRGIPEENLPSRMRAIFLMAISNKSGPMVVATGNKSELCVGYLPPYGDVSGGYNPIKDLYKTQVHALARYRNAHKPKDSRGPAGEVIPPDIIAEHQADQGSLPPYEVLDDILECLLDRQMPLAEIIARGHEADTARRVERLVALAERTRRQTAPGVVLTDRAFGGDRRYPITNRFRELP